jgi:hypothetical protein
MLKLILTRRIQNEIDDSEDSYGSTEEFVENEPMIVKAINNNAFFKEA